MKAHKSVLIGILAAAVVLVFSPAVPNALAGGPNHLSPQPEPPDSPKPGIIEVDHNKDNPHPGIIIDHQQGITHLGPQPEPPDMPNAGTPMPIPPSSPAAGGAPSDIAGISPQPEPPSSPPPGLKPGETIVINPQPEPPGTIYFHFQNLQSK
jgi:hypothetical protein